MTERTNAHFSKIFNGLKLLVLTLDENQKISYANPFFLHLINSSFASIQGKNWSDVFVHEQNTAIKDILEKTSHEKHSAQYIDELKTQDGNILLVKWNITALEDENSIYQGILCIGEDITQHMNNEASLQRQLSELASCMAYLSPPLHKPWMICRDATRLLTSVFSLNIMALSCQRTNSLIHA
jgi:PAS domain S-box-containing protein